MAAKGRTKASKAVAYHIVKVSGFEGDISAIRATPDPVYMVVGVYPDGTNAELDNGYTSIEEAAEAWPEAGRPRT